VSIALSGVVPACGTVPAAVVASKEANLSRITRLLAALALAFGVVAASSTAASAATITPTPNEIAPGDSVVFSGDVLAGGTPGCEVPSSVTLISQVFVGLGEFAGVPAVQIPVDAAGNYSASITINRAVFPGTYQITGRCGGGNLGVIATLTIDALPVTGAQVPILPLAGIAMALIALGAACVTVPRRRLGVV